MPFATPAPAPYAATVERLTQFAEADVACAGFADVSFLSDDGSLVTRDFEVSRSFGVTLVRPVRTTAPVACGDCSGVGYVRVTRPGYHERFVDCSACGGTGLPPAHVA